MLTTYDTDSHVLPAIEAGATGYLLKDCPREELLRGARAAARGESVLSPSVAARLLTPGPHPPAAAQPPRGRGPGPGRRREHQPGGGGPALHHRGHRQEPPAEHLRQAGRQRPRGGRRRGVQPGAPHPALGGGLGSPTGWRGITGRGEIFPSVGPSGDQAEHVPLTGHPTACGPGTPGRRGPVGGLQPVRSARGT